MLLPTKYVKTDIENLAKNPKWRQKIRSSYRFLDDSKDFPKSVINKWYQKIRSTYHSRDESKEYLKSVINKLHQKIMNRAKREEWINLRTELITIRAE